MSLKRKSLFLILIFILGFGMFISPTLVEAQIAGAYPPVNTMTAGGPDLQAVDSFLRQQVEQNRIPGLAVAIVQDGRVIFLKGYGEAAPGQPVTPQTQFYIGSVSKTFTSLAVMQLVEAGKLELDAPVQKYIPWFEVNDPQASAQITVRHLLNHTSGLSEQGDPDPSAYTASLEEQARLLKNVRLTAPVGTKYQYYNQNYRLLGYLIETVSGQSYGDYMREHVFVPLGMTHSATNPDDAPELAQGYSRAFGFPLPQNQRYIPGRVPSGMVISNAEDMAAFMLAQLDDTQPNGDLLLKPETLSQVRTPPAGIETEYGFGWGVRENGNTLYHGGAIENYRAFVGLGVKEKMGFVFLVNQDSMIDLVAINEDLIGGMFALLNGETPPQNSYAWIGWVLIVLAAVDMLNHVRLFSRLPDWRHRNAPKARLWLWSETLLGIFVPLAVIVGVPWLVCALMGGAPSWAEPLSLQPDLTSWLLVGMVLNVVRCFFQAVALWRDRSLDQIRVG